MTYMAKAWVGFFTALVGSLSVALGDDIVDMNDATQVVVALMTAGATLYGVYQARNAPSPKEADAPTR